MNVHLGQRLSLKGQICTVRYIGPVGAKPGEWLGVEWDNPDRGKHDGSHDGIRYFACRSNSSTAGSFLKPQQSWDPTRTFLQALREKYMSKDVNPQPAVYFSSKEAEEIGFDKFAQRQSQLQGIHVLVLDRMRINADRINEDKDAISETCANISELDLEGNLFETLQDIISLCSLLPKLRRLVIDGNRFDLTSTSNGSNHGFLRGVQTLSLSNTFMTWPELCSIVPIFHLATNLTFASNAINRIESGYAIENLVSLDLSSNCISTFDSIKGLSSCLQLQTLVLKHNLLEVLSEETVVASESSEISSTILDVDLAYNHLSSWSIIDAIPAIFPSAKHIRLTGNPIYRELRSADGKLLGNEDGYMLTIARLPQLESLNYSKITGKERLNAETYYLGQIALEISLASSADQENEILSRHPRWKALCEEYGEPSISRKPANEDIDPNSLAAKLLTISFTLSPDTLPEHSPRSWEDRIPRSINIYALLGIVAKQLGDGIIMPLGLRLIWETGERDPAGLSGGYSGPEWWDSGDEDEGPGDADADGGELVLREIELVAGTRAVGTYIEGREARVRVEMVGLE